MKYRRLGKTEISVSAVGLGAWQFGGEWGKEFTQAEAEAVIGTARDCGINLIDTAECYGDHLSESMIGKAIRHNRDSWIIATKFGHRFESFQQRQQLWRPEDVRVQLQDSLRALGTDYIDLYQFHSGADEYFYQDDLWEMLRREVEKGVIRHLGVSVNRAGADQQVKDCPRYGAEVIQVIYNRLDRRPEECVFPQCREQDLGVLARVPLASGLLSGKYRPHDTFPANDVRSRRERDQIERALREVEDIRRTEAPADVEMAAWALAWCLRNPAVTAVIPGCKSPEQVKKNAAAANLDIDERIVN
jgi:aryl-alcohol dehydrogenase-like predicted oxidoreductase